MGKWCYFQWPKKWHNSDILRDMTFLEMLPIALASCLWHKEFHKKKILYHVVNMAVVSILNSMSTKSDKSFKGPEIYCLSVTYWKFSFKSKIYQYCFQFNS